MRLTLKISLALLLSIILLFSLHSFLSVQREREQLKLNLSHQVDDLGQSLRLMMMEIERISGTEAALRFLETAALASEGLQLRWVRFDGPLREENQPRVVGNELEPLRRGESVSLLTETDQGEDVLITYLPLLDRAGRLGAIEVSKSLAGLEGYVGETVRRSYLLILATGLSGLLLMGVLGNLWVNRPVRKLSEQAERIGAGDFSQAVDLTGHDELAGLASAIDRMRDQLAMAREKEQTTHQARLKELEKLRHTERLATVGRLSAGMAHEIGTPLNVISGRAKMIFEQDLSPEGAARSAKIIGEQAERIAGLVRQLLNFARRGEASRRLIDLRDIQRGTLELIVSAANKKNVEIVSRSQDVPVRVEADPGQLQQVLLNLLTNAVQASPEGGRVSLSLAAGTSPVEEGQDQRQAKRWCTLCVEDCGEGIAASDLPHIFDPFFTTKDVGQGTGLGLSIAYGIVEEYGGSIEVDSTPGEGSRFIVSLPQVEEEEPA
jgi:signal transduction histidine kinase